MISAVNAINSEATDFEDETIYEDSPFGDLMLDEDPNEVLANLVHEHDKEILRRCGVPSLPPDQQRKVSRILDTVYELRAIDEEALFKKQILIGKLFQDI